VLGGEVLVQTLSGAIKIKTPAGTQNNKTIRVKGKGMPVHGKENVYGDLYVQVEVAIPAVLSPEEKKLFEQLKEMQAKKEAKQN
jgi:curved DNA-binding protein